MTTTQPMTSARGVRIRSLPARSHGEHSSDTGQGRPDASMPGQPRSHGDGQIGRAELVLQAFAFGPYRIIPHARLLQRDGSSTPLGGRAFDLLCIFVSRPGEVVSNSELLAKAWPGLTVEVGTLRFHIAQLRRVLGERESGERYVTNVHGRGYCFVAPVQPTASPYSQPSYA